MAIHPTIQSGVAPAPAIDIEAWTVEQAAEALRAASISSPRPARGTNVTIEIPLDVDATPADADDVQGRPQPRAREAVHTVYRRREPIRRDSLKRRDALLKGKEGSRRRQRWENDRLLSNPHAQPPLPSDWEVRPTHPVHSVPYFIAPLWEAEYSARAARKALSDSRTAASKEEQAAARVTRELRAKLKRSRGAKGLLQDLEEEVRAFVAQWEGRQRELERDGLGDADSEDEEIVFVGRNGVMSDERKKGKEEPEGSRRERLVFQGEVGDQGAAFGRWLVHSIATYYGLKTWSVTTGNPARREAYVGLDDDRKASQRVELPRPLWGLV